MRARATGVAWSVAALVLLVVGIWCAVRGVEVRASTGGLLVAPVRTVRLHGGWLVGAAAAVTAAVLVGLEAGGRLRARRP